MKTQIFSLIVTLLSLTSLNLNASTRESATELKKECSITSLYHAAHYEMVAYESLPIEAWMTNDNLWSGSAKSVFQSEQTDKEEALEIENWMIDSNVWKIKNNELEVSRLKRSNELPLKIETWMTDDNFWRL